MVLLIKKRGRIFFKFIKLDYLGVRLWFRYLNNQHMVMSEPHSVG